MYLNPEMLNFIQGSDGLAAGNTIEEAIVQAMSEIYEHYATDKLYYNNSSEIIYYQLNLHKMKSTLPEYLNNIIDKIEEGGYHLMVYDLSYNFNVPVLAAIIIDSYHVVHLNLGAAPVFNIALERTLTEIYQGRIQFKINECNKYYMKPYRAYTIAQSTYTNISSITLRDNYPEELLLNKINVSDYNHQIFLEDNSYSNNDLLSYYLKLNSMNNFEIYIRDLSQIQEIRAIRLFCANQTIFPWKHDIYKLIPLETRLKIQNIAYELNFKEEFCSDNYFMLLNQLEEILQDDTIDTTAKNEYLSFIFKDEMKIFPVSNLDKFFIYYDNLILNTDDESVLKYNYYKSLYLYKKSNKYTDKEISNIFIHGLKYSVQSQIDEDLRYILDYKYVIRKILKGEKE